MPDIAKSMVISDLDQVRIIADPLRRSVLAAFAGEPKTTKQVAKQLGIKGNKLYHHVDMLEQAGFLLLVETRPNRGTTERYLTAAADRFVVQVESVSEGTQVVKRAFDEAISEIEKLCASKENSSPMLLQGTIQISEAQMPQFEARLLELVREFKGDEKPTHSIVLAVYPTSVTDA